MILKNLKVDIPILDVPYFKQTRHTTCGPASLMMVMKYWDESIELSKNVEFQIWMSSNPFVFLGGTLQFGLAKSAVEMGFKAEIYQKTSFSSYYKNFRNLIDLYEKIVSYRAIRKNVSIHLGKDIINLIPEALIKKIPPIVFLNLKPISYENVFHWLVVTGMDERNIYVNDPYIPLSSKLKMKKDHPIKIDIFRKAISTNVGRKLRIPPCTIFVYK